MVMTVDDAMSRFLFNLLLVSLVLMAPVLSVNANAQTVLLAEDGLSPNAGGYLARILHNSPQEVASALERAETLYLAGDLTDSVNPIAIVLHGPEVEIFFKENYLEYKGIVDLAARLSAFGVVDVRVCEFKTRVMGRERSSVHHFIGTVPFGPDELERLVNQKKYVYF